MSGSLYVVAGELSGDVHAAGLLDALIAMRPGLEIRGAGGARMRAVAGEGIHDWLDQSAVMGIVEVLKHYSFFKQSFDRMLAEIMEQRPEVLLLVDYPGFNFRFAKAVRKALPETKIVQYVCPQVWAWKKGRIPRMVELFDEVLCLLPFEPKIFAKTRLKATFVGHPLVDELEESRLPACELAKREADLVALLPGSRRPEVDKLFPMMLETAKRLRVGREELRFAVPAANSALKARMLELSREVDLGGRLEILDGGAHELMQKAACGVVASGTATVEAGYYGLPYCLVYRLAWPTFLVAKMVVKIEFAGLVNILAGEEIVEEFIQSEADPCRVSRALEVFLDRPAEVARLQARLKETLDKLGGAGAHRRAAQAVNAWFP
ncbi:MAG: lipid-A-disaccharide synthase [Verrucomicrobiales bacterium]